MIDLILYTCSYINNITFFSIYFYMLSFTSFLINDSVIYPFYFNTITFPSIVVTMLYLTCFCTTLSCVCVLNIFMLIPLFSSYYYTFMISWLHVVLSTHFSYCLCEHKKSDLELYLHLKFMFTFIIRNSDNEQWYCYCVSTILNNTLVKFTRLSYANCSTFSIEFISIIFYNNWN